MRTTFRNALLALVLILGLVGEMKAQDRYEYATVIYAGNGIKAYNIYISESNTYREVSGKLTEGYTTANHSPVNELLAEMAKQGWEVYNTALSPAAATYYYLKRQTK